MCMYVCTYVCMYVCMYVYIYVYVYTCIYVLIDHGCVCPWFMIRVTLQPSVERSSNSTTSDGSDSTIFSITSLDAVGVISMVCPYNSDYLLFVFLPATAAGTRPFFECFLC